MFYIKVYAENVLWPDINARDDLVLSVFSDDNIQLGF